MALTGSVGAPRRAPGIRSEGHQRPLAQEQAAEPDRAAMEGTLYRARTSWGLGIALVLLPRTAAQQDADREADLIHPRASRTIMNLMKMLLAIMQSVLALVVAFIALGLVNLAAGWVLNAALPGSLDAEGLPLTSLAQGIYLPILFVAGMAGAFLVVFGAPRAPAVHAVVFGGLALLGDVIVVRDYADIWATWFSVLVVVTVPPQVWLGGVLGVRARRRWAPWARAGSTGAPAEASLASDQTLALPIREKP